MTSKGNERKGPWHHAAVAALQGASIEEQLQYLDPDLVRQEEMPYWIDGPALGIGALGASVLGPAQNAGPPPDDSAANRAAMRIWARWDVHGRGRIIRR